MQRATLNAVTRESGKGPARRLRLVGKIPAVLYGAGDANQTLALDERLLDKVLHTAAGANVLIDLTINEKEKFVTRVKEVQSHPISRSIRHIDLQAVDLTKKMEVEVPLHFEGKCAGVKEGGVLEVSRRKLLVRCLPTAIPEFITVDISGLQIGDNLHANDLQLADGIEFPHTENFSIVQVVAPQKEEVAAPVAVAAGEVPATEATAAAAAAGAAAAAATPDKKAAEKKAPEKKGADKK